MEAMALIELNQLYAAKNFRELASHPQLHLKPEWALELAKNGDIGVRIYLATNPVLAQLPDVVLALSQDISEMVRQALAQNPAIAEFPGVAMKLANALTIAVREALCANPAMKKLPKVMDKASQRTFKYCTVQWVEWEPGRYGSLRHPVKVERSAENCTITFTDGLAHIILPDGTRFTKRRSTPTWSYRAHRRPTKSTAALKQTGQLR